MPFRIIRNDITRVRADVIVNTANPDPVYGAGTDYAIYMAAGPRKLLAEREKIGKIGTGETAVTPAFRLKAKYIIHTVGPVWEGGTAGELGKLASCYRKSLLLAKQLGCGSIAFPLISTGVYGFPKDKALSVALSEISRFLEDSEMDVTLVVFNKEAYDLSAGLSESVEQFIDDHYVKERSAQEYEDELREYRRERWLQQRRPGRILRDEVPEASVSAPAYTASMPAPSAARESAEEPVYADQSAGHSLPDMMKHLGESYQERLLRLIDERGLKDSEVYKKANIDRKLFSKIRCNPRYSPKKTTAVALALALKLSMRDTEDLLARAGYAFSPSSKFDLIVEYCIMHEIYDIIEINSILFEYDQPMLGS